MTEITNKVMEVIAFSVLLAVHIASYVIKESIMNGKTSGLLYFVLE